ncbi:MULTISPECIES: hypothetical protein [unclassified Methanosarcina]|uniref:hypothetical protein n=1 Tax=unclassified Methanosarcina TaxID=2644672 RepID=UPI0006156DDF|nr:MULTISPECIES: hypothetical protein [unclassified Methanosarcina]AKB18423.1 Chromosome segregation ATPase [Methanosarcina sp. WWM596]
MKYTFQDSTELPVQRDFIQDLQDFIRISKEAIPLEKSIIEIKQGNKEETTSSQGKLEEIDRFQADVVGYMEELTQGIESQEILEIKAKIIETSSTASLLKKNERLEDIDRQNRLALSEVQQFETRILATLSPFFETSIYGAEHAYYASGEDKELKGRQVSSVNGIQYEFELNFVHNSLKVEDLQEFTLPVRAKSGILSREEKVKKMNVSDFRIMSIEYEGDSIRTVLQDKDAEHMFTISADDRTFLILYGDHDITGDEKLAPLIDREALYMFMVKLKEFFTESVGSKRLRRIMLDGKNAVEENTVFDCLKIIAGIYGKLVRECIERGYTKEEVTIKMEESASVRTEKYISKSEASSELSSIGSEGMELATILGVAEA